MKSYFYCIDGQTVEGPISSDQLLDYLKKGILIPETPLCLPGEKDWHPLKDCLITEQTPSSTSTPPPPEKEIEAVPDIDLQAVREAGSDQMESENDEEPILSKKDSSQTLPKRITKGEYLRLISKDLDLLWHAQRESILARIADEELDAEFETTRKQTRDITKRIEQSTIEYWRRSQLLEKWVAEMVWQETDLVRWLRGENSVEKFEDVKSWLSKAKIWEKAGCYAFLRHKEYLYIGQTTLLSDRLKDRFYYGDATHLRIIIPRDKRWIGKVERLLILAHSPRFNKQDGERGNNPADNCLGFIRHEIKELVTDAD